MELLVAAWMLAVVISGTVAALIACVGLTNASKNTHIATTAALALAEEIHSAPFTQIFDDYNALNFTVNAIPSSMGTVTVDDTDTELLGVTISICWRQGNRVIGEDTNLDGTLSAAENANSNGNGVIDSPVQIVMQVANR